MAAFARVPLEGSARATFSIVCGISRAVSIFPRRVALFLGLLFGLWVGIFLRIRRRHVEASMRRAFIRRGALGMYKSLGRSLFELLWISGRRRDLSQLVAIDRASLARWQAALACGRGVVIAASHTGNWDLAACAFAQSTRLLVVTKRLRVRSLDAFWQSSRSAYGVSLVESNGAIQSATQHLRSGGAVAMMIDQVPGSTVTSVCTDFLGAPVHVDRAAAALAFRTRAPLVVAAARRGADRKQHLEVLDVLYPTGRSGRLWITSATIAATSRLDSFIRKYPSEWLWLHRRWRAPDRATERLSPLSPGNALA